MKTIPIPLGMLLYTVLVPSYGTLSNELREKFANPFLAAFFGDGVFVAFGGGLETGLVGDGDFAAFLGDGVFAA